MPIQTPVQLSISEIEYLVSTLCSHTDIISEHDSLFQVITAGEIPGGFKVHLKLNLSSEKDSCQETYETIIMLTTIHGWSPSNIVRKGNSFSCELIKEFHSVPTLKDIEAVLKELPSMVISPLKCNDDLILGHYLLTPNLPVLKHIKCKNCLGNLEQGLQIYFRKLNIKYSLVRKGMTFEVKFSKIPTSK